MNTIKSDTDPNGFRILVIDDNPAIHNDFRKVLGTSRSALKDELDEFEAGAFGDAANAKREIVFEIDSAFQGQEGLEKVRAAVAEGRPYSVAFVDVRMPPGWDGVETITHISKEVDDLQIVICTAYSDYSWDAIAQAIGDTDNVLVLKKPFDNVEVMQMAHALSRKWELTRFARRHMEDLEARVDQRTAELRTANKKLTGEAFERAAAETALRHSEERFSKAFHGNPVPMAIRRLDISGFLDANASFVSLLGASREEALAGGALLWTEPGTDERILGALADSRAMHDLPASIRTHAGETREVLVTAQILNLGDVPYQLLILQDITNRTRLESELRQSQKMEAVGRLAAGVAHDFNNILTVILGNTTMQLARPRLDEKLALALQQVVRAAEQATALTRQLLAYSRRQILRRRPLRLNDMVVETVGMLQRIIGEHIAVDLQLGADLPPIFADATNVDQVIMNLALNARDAMLEGGRLTISSTAVEIDENGCADNAEAKPGSYVRLSVRDDGEGMDETTVARIFEPFFTTKEQGKGTGMGLATVYGILKQHEGWIEVRSEPGHGTEVSAFFPVSEDTVVEERAEIPLDISVPGASEPFTILVVEDEPMLRDFVCQALTLLGYRILPAANGRAALEIWAAHRGEIDLLLTDVVMPGTPTGRQLAHQLTVEKPDLKVVFTSGYSAELLGADFEQDREHGFLAKPYLTDHLAKYVATRLNPTH